jgi:hypothetical protein
MEEGICSYGIRAFPYRMVLDNGLKFDHPYLKK